MVCKKKKKKKFKLEGKPGMRKQLGKMRISDKKFMVKVHGKIIHFGARGYRIKPGTKAGNAYCARSSGIKGANNPNSANFWSRLMWKCKGKKSIK
jgi:hypothetical protein